MRACGFVLALTLALPAAMAAQPVLEPTRVTVTAVDAPLTEIFSTIAKAAGIEIRVDEAVPSETKDRKVGHVTFKDTNVEDALRFLVSRSGLTLEIVDSKTVRVRVKQ